MGAKKQRDRNPCFAIRWIQAPVLGRRKTCETAPDKFPGAEEFTELLRIAELPYVNMTKFGDEAGIGSAYQIGKHIAGHLGTL